MKADESMPFFGGMFFDAVEGYSDAVAIGYIRALWHYWNHTHCQGLPDEDEYLRRICRCDSQQWARTKGVIFDNQFFFCKNGTHWHQKKAKELHAKEIELYNRRVAWAENARIQKAQSNVNPDIKPNVSPSVTAINSRAELERVEKRIEEIRQQGTLVAGSPMRYSTKQKSEMIALKDRREELKKLLGFVA